MNLHFHWINLLILFGAFQALLFSIILLFNKKHPGSKFLSIFVFALAYNGFETFNWSAGLDKYYMFFDMFCFIVIYSIGPALFLYVSSLLNPAQTFSKKTIAAHFGLLIFQFISRVAIIIYHLLWINKIIVSDISSMDLMSIGWYYAEPLSVIMFIVYLVLTIHKFRKFKSLNLRIQSLDTAEQVMVFNWIKTLLACLSIFAATWALTVILPNFVKIPIDSQYYPIEVGLVLFIYWIAFNGYHKMKLIYVPASRPMSSTNQILLTQDSNNPATAGQIQEFKAQPVASVDVSHFPDVSNYPDQSHNPGESHIPDEFHNPDESHYTDQDQRYKTADPHPLTQVPSTIPNHDHYLALIQEAMEPGKLYLDPDLNLSKLSAHTCIPPKLISAVLNQYNQTNFNDFINGYRVTQVSLLMMDPSSRHFTISSLAMDAGFNSQATFQRAFKKHTGISPRQFIARNLKKSA